MRWWLILLVSASVYFEISEGCQTSPFCFYHQSWCDYARKYYGLMWYNKCLESLCRHCKLCGVCDGKNQALRATLSERYQCVEVHNKLRALHQDTGPLEWDFKLSAEAQEFAEHLVNTVKLVHGAVGENLFLKIGSNGTTVKSCTSATNAWYNEIKFFDWKNFNSTVKGEAILHFTQVVWKSAKKIGIGIAIHKSTKFVYVVARYDEPNKGHLSYNVMPLKP